MKWQFPDEVIYQVMTEQPDTCYTCGSRLALIESTRIEGEQVFVCECTECQRIIPVVEFDMPETTD